MEKNSIFLTNPRCLQHLLGGFRASNTHDCHCCISTYALTIALWLPWFDFYAAATLAPGVSTECSVRSFDAFDSSRHPKHDEESKFTVKIHLAIFTNHYNAFVASPIALSLGIMEPFSDSINCSTCPRQTWSWLWQQTPPSVSSVWIPWVV